MATSFPFGSCLFVVENSKFYTVFFYIRFGYGKNSTFYENFFPCVCFKSFVCLKVHFSTKKIAENNTPMFIILKNNHCRNFCLLKVHILCKICYKKDKIFELGFKYKPKMK